MMTMMAGGGDLFWGVRDVRGAQSRQDLSVYWWGEACGREACSWQRLVGQMGMRGKTGDRGAVGKKARPMGARQAHARKSKAYPLLGAVAGLGSSWRWWWAVRCVGDSSFLR